MLELFPNKSGAQFSECRKYRYALWRVWDHTKPLVMFIGLNPSTANEVKNDHTIRKVIGFSKRWGYGGVYMMNCFSFITKNPKLLQFGHDDVNAQWLQKVSEKCKEVVFAWGTFKVVRETKKDLTLSKMFPDAKALAINKGGSPAHPLLIPYNIILIKYQP